MAIKPTTPAAAKAAPAKAQKATKAETTQADLDKSPSRKAPKEPKEPKEPRVTAHTLARTLVAANHGTALAKQLTNDEIFAKVNEQFPDSGFKKSYVNIKRWDLNFAELGEGFKDGSVPAKYLEVVEHEGKRMYKKDVPKPEKKARTKREKVDPATDPLNTVAGLGVTGGAKKAAATKAAPAAPAGKTAAKKA
jgi:hypothetical protein